MPKNIVLCVDDEPNVLRACSIATAEAGLLPVVAENGAAGLETFIRLRYQICLVLSDVVMPGKFNGIDLAELILKIEPQTKILMMTGYSDEVIEIEGPNRFPLIRKPFLIAALTEKIRSVLGLCDAAASMT